MNFGLILTLKTNISQTLLEKKIFRGVVDNIIKSILWWFQINRIRNVGGEKNCVVKNMIYEITRP